MGFTILLLALSGTWSAVYLSPTPSEVEENSGKKYFEVLSSSHNEETSWNGTHRITVHTVTRKTNTNGTISSQKETTYTIHNNKGGTTTYTVKDP